MNRFTSILLIIFATCNLLWMIGFPEFLYRKADNKVGAEVVVENQTEVDKSNSSETDERSNTVLLNLFTTEKMLRKVCRWILSPI